MCKVRMWRATLIQHILTIMIHIAMIVSILVIVLTMSNRSLGVIMCSLKSGHCNDDATRSVSGIQNPLIYGSAASFVYKCFLPGPTERLKKLRFVGKMSDQYNVIIFPSIIYLVLLIAITHKYKPRSRAWVRGCILGPN